MFWGSSSRCRFLYILYILKPGKSQNYRVLHLSLLRPLKQLFLSFLLWKFSNKSRDPLASTTINSWPMLFHLYLPYSNRPRLNIVQYFFPYFCKINFTWTEFLLSQFFNVGYPSEYSVFFIGFEFLFLRELILNGKLFLKMWLL